jgi:hypothetical protein
VLCVCWSAKGGSGTTVVAASLALLLARTSREGALLADLAGDVPAVLGLPEPSGPGLNDWLRAGDEVGAEALGRLESAVGAGLALLPVGTGAMSPSLAAARSGVLAEALAGSARPVVVDAGLIGEGGAWLELAASAPVSLLVIRPCYLALRRAVALPVRPSGVVLVREPGRALAKRDVEDALGVEVRAELALDPQIARAVDAGLLARRLPRELAQRLRHAA